MGYVNFVSCGQLVRIPFYGKYLTQGALNLPNFDSTKRTFCANVKAPTVPSIARAERQLNFDSYYSVFSKTFYKKSKKGGAAGKNFTALLS